MISRDTILDLGDYERRRDDIRRSAIAARAARRVILGPNATIAFENRETVAYQIQEMLRAERIAKDADVQHEIETYSDLLPTRDELSATMMFEFPDADGRDVRLAELVGFEDHLWLDLAGSKAPASFDRRQLDPDRISAVQFIRFPIGDAQRDALARGEGVRIVSDHPAYSYSTEIPPHTCRALAEDLRDG
ncbi:MAG TPA: DUF3501 family protein [Thermoanaerobaculia bacterium]|jgi:hypothetical protein|nr:DUF3501 family protein [Thermoanaerobaculia bacterium]